MKNLSREPSLELGGMEYTFLEFLFGLFRKLAIEKLEVFDRTGQGRKQRRNLLRKRYREEGSPPAGL